MAGEFDADDADGEEEAEEVTGYTYTRADCPCGYINYVEGDARGHIFKCEDCNMKLLIAEVI